MYWGYIGWDYIWEYHGNMLGMVIQGRRGPWETQPAIHWLIFKIVQPSNFCSAMSPQD